MRGECLESRAKCSALKLLCMQKLSGMHSLRMLDLRRMKTDIPVTVGSVQSYLLSTGASAEEMFPDGIIPDGITFKHGGVNIILYNEAVRNQKRIKWTIAHEMGHIMCGHTQYTRQFEREADEFASQLLLPDCVIRYIERKNRKKMTPEKLSDAFAVSLSACRVKRKLLDYCKNCNTDEILLYENKLVKSLFGFSETELSVEELEQKWFDLDPQL